jgi:glycosyltransferase involved in cell wall biosynthesis
MTYNHAKFIRQAVEGILMQDPPDGFDVIVADDASTDETRDIVASMFNTRPGIALRFLDSSYNRGITRNYERAFTACGGDYIAVLEGDDYWTSPRKLAVQMAFLDEHRECGACATNYFVYDMDDARFTSRYQIDQEFFYADARSLIRDNVIGNFSTCMYRKTALAGLPAELFATRAYDWAVNICISQTSLIGLLREPMSVYRIHKGGTWGGLSQEEKTARQLANLADYDKATGQVFHTEFETLASELRQARDRAIHEKSAWRTWVPRLGRIAKAFVPPGLVRLGHLIVPPAVPITWNKIKRRL